MTEPDIPDSPDSSDRDPVQAARMADEQLRRQNQQWGAVRRLVGALASLGMENHFTDKIVKAIRGDA